MTSNEYSVKKGITVKALANLMYNTNNRAWSLPDFSGCLDTAWLLYVRYGSLQNNSDTPPGSVGCVGYCILGKDKILIDIIPHEGMREDPKNLLWTFRYSVYSHEKITPYYFPQYNSGLIMPPILTHPHSHSPGKEKNKNEIINKKY